MNEKLKEYDNTFLFYNNPMDWSKNIPDSVILREINPYQNITKIFGEQFSMKLKSIGFEVFNLQRVGAIDRTLSIFENCEGFDILINSMKPLTKLITSTDKETQKFKKYFNQLLRYFSELLFPQFLMGLHKGRIKFQPRDIGSGLKSCDNVYWFDDKKIYVEITTINTLDQKNLETKVLDIFELKAQEQLNFEELGLLVIDITTSGSQYFDFKENKFYVNFEIFDNLVKFISKELEKDDNKHLIGVAIIGNIISEKDKEVGLTWICTIKENKKNIKSSIVKDILRSTI